MHAMGERRGEFVHAIRLSINIPGRHRGNQRGPGAIAAGLAPTQPCERTHLSTLPPFSRILTGSA